MKMKQILPIVCVLLSSAVIQASEVKLSNQKKLFAAGQIVDKNRKMEPVWAARLNPAGTHLIYPVPITVETEKQETRYDLEVFDLSNSTRNRIGVSLSQGFETVFTRFNCFDPSGLQLAAFRDRPQDESSLEDNHVSQQTEIVLYDLKENKLLPTGLYGPNQFGRFDHTGKWLFMQRGNAKASLSDFRMQPISLPGWIHSPSMYSEYATVFVSSRLPAKEGERRPRRVSGLQIWSLTTNTKLAELPVHPDNDRLDDVGSEWTGDGRHVYYFDIRGERDDRTPLARIWEVEANKEKPVIEDALSVGPGPGKSTMVMVRVEENKVGGMFLHCADENREIPFGTPDMKLIHAWGNKIIYVQPDNGIETVYAADIELGERLVKPQ